MSKESNIAIRVENLHKSFSLVHDKSNSLKSSFIKPFKKNKVEVQKVLDGVSFEIKKGEFFGIVGRNGSGKSTLLKLLAGIYTPDKGGVHVNGKLVPFIELGVGFNPELSGRDNVYLNGALLGFSRKDMDAMYDEIIDFAELHDHMEKKLKNYSSGMQVRLAFSIAVRSKADILLLDEVLAVGDEAFQKKCFDYFGSLKENKTTVVLVTHSMDSVKRYCDRAILLEKGSVMFESGRVEKVADQYSKLFNPNTHRDNNKLKTNYWGTGEITIDKIRHSISKKSLDIEFDLVNHTSHNYKSGIDIGIDIYSHGELVSGTNYLKSNPGGIGIKANDRKRLKVSIPNNFGKHKFVVNMNIRNDHNRVVCYALDEIFSFYNNYGNSQFYKIVSMANWE